MWEDKNAIKQPTPAATSKNSKQPVAVQATPTDSSSASASLREDYRSEDPRTVGTPTSALASQPSEVRPAGMTDAEWEHHRRPHRDVLTFLQDIGQKLKNAQTANYPPTVVKITEEIDAYIAHLGSGRIKGYGVEHRDGKERAVPR